MDFPEIRSSLKALLYCQNISPDTIDRQYHLYYDETNNVKKFRIKDETGNFNVDSDSIFVLGGIEGEGTITLDELQSLFKLQSNVNEIKSGHIYNGKLEDCLKSKKLDSFLNLLEEKGWHIHFSSLNLLYWSIVDILDSIDACVSDQECGIMNLKAMLYSVAKSDKDRLVKMMYRHKYPDIKDMKSLHSFIEELIEMCRNYDVHSDSAMSKHKERLIACLNIGLQQTSAPFIQNEQELMLLKSFRDIYLAEIYTWVNSTLVFDKEDDIISSLEEVNVEVDERKVENYTFADSKSNTMIQLSDIAVGIVSKYLQFIDTYGTNAEAEIARFSKEQMNTFNKLNRDLKKSRDHNSVFFPQTNSIEHHGVLNQLIDKYGIKDIQVD